VGASAATPRITSVAAPPLVAAPGDRIAIKAKVRGTGRRVAVGLVLGNATGSAMGGVGLGAGLRVAFRGARRVVVRGVVPANVSPGVLRTLLVCVDPAAAIKGAGACRSAGRLATTGKSIAERVAGARLTGRLSAANAILFGLLALRSDKRVPQELRGGVEGPGGEEAAIMEAADSFGSLPPAIQRQVLSFFVPPPGQGTAWSTPGRKKRHQHARHAAVAASAAVGCTGYEKLDRGYYSGNLYPWRGVPTSDGKAIVWYQVNSALPVVAAKDRATAYRYARELPKIWAKLTAEFGVPLSDGSEPCYHGPDGRYDVYVDSAVVSIESRFAKGVLALTIPYPGSGAKFCTHRPSWIAIRNDISNWALAHEFMHALQFSHSYASCGPPILWWDEGGATWAADFVYPEDNTEQREYPDLVTNPLGQQLANTEYAAWPFWMMLQRTQGTGVLRAIFASLASKPPVAAVDAAIPGGFAKQLPRFFLHALNQSPVGDSGSPIPTSFQAWDHWSANPNPPAPVTLGLGSLPADTLSLPIQRPDFPPLSLGSYHRVTIPDDAVKQLRFTNDLAGRAGAHVEALLHMADGSWKLADWTSNKSVTLCRERASENVRDMIIVSTNAGQTALSPFTHTLQASATCPFPHRFIGTWTRVYTWPERGSWTETIKGTATYVHNPLFAPENDQLSQVPYLVESASVTWTVSGTTGGPCALVFSGSGGEPLTGENGAGVPTDFGLENVTGKAGAPNPEPMPYYYSIRASVDGLNAPEYTVKDCKTTTHESVVLPYLEIGHPGPLNPETPPAEIQKSADPTLLQGHHVGSDKTSVFTIDDTWSFKGSE
jgi:hypothetical protein